METGRFFRLAAIIVPLVIFTGCSGGGGGSDGVDNPEPTGSTAAPLSDSAAGIPIVGEIIADCTEVGVGLVDTLIDAVEDLVGDTLPVDLPHLADILDQVDPADVPVIGGLVPAPGGELEAISLEDLLAQVPGGLDLGDLPVLGQLPTVCSSLVEVLPPGAIGDPAILLAALGDPAGALGLMPILDESGNPVGVILASLPSALMTGGIPGLPSGTPIPALDSIAPFDPADVPLLGSLVESLLGILSGGGVGGLGGLTGLLGFLGFLL